MRKSLVSNKAHTQSWMRHGSDTVDMEYLVRLYTGSGCIMTL